MAGSPPSTFFFIVDGWFGTNAGPILYPFSRGTRSLEIDPGMGEGVGTGGRVKQKIAVNIIK